MAYTQRLGYEVLRSIDSATFTGSYQALGAPLIHACSLIKLINNSGVLVTISIDGVNDHDVAPANSFWLYDVTSDSVKQSDVFVRAGRQYFVKGAASTGLVYLVVQFVEVQ